MSQPRAWIWPQYAASVLLFFPYQMERKTPFSNDSGSAVWIALTAAVSLAIVTLMATYLGA